MIALDEDALICDLAETYHVLDYRSLPLSLVGALSYGLREDSRIRMKLADSKLDVKTNLMCQIVDNLRILCWSKTKDAQKGENPPQLIMEKIYGTRKESEYETFDSGTDFMKAWKAIVGK